MYKSTHFSQLDFVQKGPEHVKCVKFGLKFGLNLGGVLFLSHKKNFIRGMRTALIVGITGHVGKRLIDKLLNSRSYRRLHSISRKDHRKIKNIHLVKHIVDFDNLEAHRDIFEQVEEVFCLVGSAYVNMNNQDEPEKLDYDYPIHVAKLAKSSGVKRFLLINPTMNKLNSSDPVMQKRKKLEDEIQCMGFEDFHVIRANKVTASKHWITPRKKWMKFVSFLGELIGKNPGGYNRIPGNILADEIFSWALSRRKLKKTKS